MTWQMYRVGVCSYQGQFVHLTRTETEIVSALLLRRGQRVRLHELIEAVYPDPDFEPDTAKNCILVLLSRVRRKLPGLIQTLGWGWIIDTPHELRAAA